MGTEYYLYNHEKATFFELGKGPWYILNDAISILYNVEKFLDLLKKEWDDFSADSEEAKNKYFYLVAQAVQEFVKDTPERFIKCFGDTGEADLWADYLKYEFVGSRYYLGCPKEYKKYVDYIKARVAEDQAEASDAIDYDDGEKEMMRIEGWNFKNITGRSHA